MNIIRKLRVIFSDTGTRRLSVIKSMNKPMKITFVMVPQPILSPRMKSKIIIAMPTICIVFPNVIFLRKDNPWWKTCHGRGCPAISY